MSTMKRYLVYIGDIETAIRQYPDDPYKSGTTVWIVDLMDLTDQQCQILADTFRIGEERLSMSSFDQLSPPLQLLVKTKVPTWDEIPADVMIPTDLRDVHKAARVLQAEMAQQANAYLNRHSFPTADSTFPAIAHAASGRGIPESAEEAYKTSIEWADEPAEVVVRNETPITVRDEGIYGDVLRALIDSQNPDEKYRHYAMYQSGIGYMDIAKSENPDWETQYGKEQAHKLWATEADKIRKQVQSIDHLLAKRKHHE
jgi:hypothetical protein